MTEFGHASQYVALPDLGPAHVCNRVVSRRRFRQSREHRELRHVELIELLAEVDLRCGAEPVSALAEVNLVDVQLQYFVLGQAVLNLEGQKRLVEFATERFFSTQEEVSSNLHGDCAGALPPAGGREVRHRGADHPDVVHATVFVEALVFRGDDCFSKHLRRLLEFHECAFFLPELADEFTLDAVDLQRNFGLIGSQRFKGRQLRIGDYGGVAHDQSDAGRKRSQCHKRI